MLRIEKALRKRRCQHCGRDILKGEACIRVYINKSRSYCVKCMYLYTHRLMQHFDVNEIKDSLLEVLI